MRRVLILCLLLAGCASYEQEKRDHRADYAAWFYEYRDATLRQP